MANNLTPGPPINEREYRLLRVQEVLSILDSLVQNYRLLIGGAEEFNRITPAHRSDVDDAVDRADDAGDIIDDVIDVLDKEVNTFLKVLEREEYIVPISPYFSPSHGIFPQIELTTNSDVEENAEVIEDLDETAQGLETEGEVTELEVEIIESFEELAPELAEDITEIAPELED